MKGTLALGFALSSIAVKALPTETATYAIYESSQVQEPLCEIVGDGFSLRFRKLRKGYVATHVTLEGETHRVGLKSHTTFYVTQPETAGCRELLQLIKSNGIPKLAGLRTQRKSDINSLAKQNETACAVRDGRFLAVAGRSDENGNFPLTLHCGLAYEKSIVLQVMSLNPSGNSCEPSSPLAWLDLQSLCSIAPDLDRKVLSTGDPAKPSSSLSSCTIFSQAKEKVYSITFVPDTDVTWRPAELRCGTNSMPTVAPTSDPSIIPELWRLAALIPPGSLDACREILYRFSFNKLCDLDFNGLPNSPFETHEAAITP